MTTRLRPPATSTILPATRRRAPEAVAIIDWTGTHGTLTFDGHAIAAIIYTGRSLHVRYFDDFSAADRAAFTSWCADVDAHCGIEPAGPGSSPYGEEVSEYFGVTNWWPELCSVPDPVAHLIITLTAELTTTKDLNTRYEAGSVVYMTPGSMPQWLTAPGLSSDVDEDLALLRKVVPHALLVWRNGEAQPLHLTDRRHPGASQ